MKEIIAERYRIEALLGKGDFGAVYEAVDRVLGTSRVALKLFANELIGDATNSSRFGREVLAMTRVEHVNVIRFFNIVYDEARQLVGYTMELVQGASLAELYEAGPRFNFTEIREALRQVCLGTHALHERNIIHRDLKPENVIVTALGTCKIVDFGVAHVVGRTRPIFSEDDSDLNGLAGTPDYISPEVLAGAEPDVQSDIYAIGVLAYQLITGGPPFGGYPLLESLKLKIKQDPPPPMQFRANCPRAFSEIVQIALSRDLNVRYQTIPQLLKALDSLDLADETQKGTDFSPKVRLGKRVMLLVNPELAEPEPEPEPPSQFFALRAFDMVLVTMLFCVIILLGSVVAFPQKLLVLLDSYWATL